MFAYLLYLSTMASANAMNCGAVKLASGFENCTISVKCGLHGRKRVEIGRGLNWAEEKLIFSSIDTRHSIIYWLSAYPLNISSLSVQCGDFQSYMSQNRTMSLSALRFCTGRIAKSWGKRTADIEHAKLVVERTLIHQRQKVYNPFIHECSKVKGISLIPWTTLDILDQGLSRCKLEFTDILASMVGLCAKSFVIWCWYFWQQKHQ